MEALVLSQILDLMYFLAFFVIVGAAITSTGVILAVGYLRDIAIRPNVTLCPKGEKEHDA